MKHRIILSGIFALLGLSFSITAQITDRTFYISPEQHKYVMSLNPIARDKFIDQDKTVIRNFFRKNIPAQIDDWRTIGTIEGSPTLPQYMYGPEMTYR